MCGELKHEKMSKRIGNPIPMKTESGTESGMWGGHARSEELPKWLAGGWKLGTLESVTSYTEGKGEKLTWFQVPIGKAIQIIYFPGDSGKYKSMRIVTRPADENEIKIHDRFPKIV